MKMIIWIWTSEIQMCFFFFFRWIWTGLRKYPAVWTCGWFMGPVQIDRMVQEFIIIFSLSPFEIGPND